MICKLRVVPLSSNSSLLEGMLDRSQTRNTAKGNEGCQVLSECLELSRKICQCIFGNGSVQSDKSVAWSRYQENLLQSMACSRSLLK